MNPEKRTDTGKKTAKAPAKSAARCKMPPRVTRWAIPTHGIRFYFPGKGNTLMAITKPTRNTGIWVASIIAVVFGLLTIKSGGSVLFIDGLARKEAGNYVPFVVWFNFLMGFAYLTAGTGLFMRKTWAIWLSIFIAASAVLIFLLFGIHVLNGGAYETRTVIAMTLRTTIWASIAVFAYLIFQRKAR